MAEVDGIGVRLIDSLLSQPDLDSVQSFFVSNSVCDGCPEWQRALLKFIQAGRDHSEGESVEQVELPELQTWPVETLLKAGLLVMCSCEAAAQTGQPMLMDFGFRLLQFWYLGISRAACERML